MFTKRELYIIAEAIFQKKSELKKRDVTNNSVKMSPEAFDEYLELSVLHFKLKDLINER